MSDSFVTPQMVVPGSSVHAISQARILEWVAISFSRGSSRHRDQTPISCTGRQMLYHWATKDAATARKIQTLWPILGKANADNRLWSENEMQTFMLERRASEQSGMETPEKEG